MFERTANDKPHECHLRAPADREAPPGSGSRGSAPHAGGGAPGPNLLAACAVLAATDFITGPVVARRIVAGRFLVDWLGWRSRTIWTLTEALERRAAREPQQAPAARRAGTEEPERRVTA